MNNKLDRRNFLGTVSMAGMGLALNTQSKIVGADVGAKPAILGGPKAYPDPRTGWPRYDKTEEERLLNVLKSKLWGRLDGKVTASFETEYQKMLGVNHALGVSSGTAALITMMGALDIGPGDEVILPPYTFIATYNAIVLNYALPVFVDTDIESFQIDADKIERSITKQTKVVMPVHIGGSPANLDKVMDVCNKNKVIVVEDACQAHLAEWKGKTVGGYGKAGAFSFQSSKNLTCGEGGAIISNDEDFIKTCYNFHNQGQGGKSAAYSPGEGTRGTNLRLTEFQGTILLAQMTRLKAQSERRWENARYLTKMLSEIPGIMPAKLYEGTTRSAYHLYMFRYDAAQFANLPREKFLKALEAEGVPCSPGYPKVNKVAYVTDLAKNRHYLKLYGEKAMAEWLEKNECPENDKLTEQAVWFFQAMLLGSRTDMDKIVEAVRKIKKHANQLNKI